MQISRRAFVGATLATGLATLPTARALAQSAKYRLRYGTAFPADHPGVLRINEAGRGHQARRPTAWSTCRSIRTASSAASRTCSRRPAPARSTSCRPSGVNQTVVPIGGINAVAFAFESYDKVWAAMDGDLGNHVRGLFGKVGLYVLPKMPRQRLSQHHLEREADRHTGRSQGLQDPRAGQSSCGSPCSRRWAPRRPPINFGELYAALQTHVVDGQENPLALIQQRQALRGAEIRAR